MHACTHFKLLFKTLAPIHSTDIILEGEKKSQAPGFESGFWSAIQMNTMWCYRKEEREKQIKLITDHLKQNHRNFMILPSRLKTLSWAKYICCGLGSKSHPNLL